MKKKALALAVAGALGAPALVFAQASTVQIYGNVRIDYQKVDQGDGLKKPDGFSSYDSYIGFRGEEKLGGGLSAWFQCESTFNPSGEENEGNGFCTRNTGVGFKGAWGNIFFGNWDTPYKISAGSVYRPFSTSGSFGNAGLLHNGSASNVGNGLLAGVTPIGAGTGANENAGWSRRQANTVNFHSGNFAGFQILAAYSATDEVTQLTNAAAPTSKPRLWSAAGTYTAGPLYLALAYEEHKAYSPGGQAFGFGPGQYQDGKDKSWQVVAAFTIGPVRLGASYNDKKYEVARPAAGPLGGTGNLDVKQKAWAVYADWQIVGPHSLRLGYVHADDASGDGTVNVNNITAPRVAATGAFVGDTGAKLYLIQYAYAFSKRTEVNFGYAKLDNDANARYNLQSFAARNTCQGAPAGCSRDQDAFVLGVRHRF
jgi:predicted porin